MSLLKPLGKDTPAISELAQKQWVEWAWAAHMKLKAYRKGDGEGSQE